MHKIAEAGVASHWLYKIVGCADQRPAPEDAPVAAKPAGKPRESGDSVEFLEHLKVDLFPDEVYVFTPKGKILSLPRGATAVDFAYSVHTDIGNRCVAVKVNSELVPLRTELKNGDRVEIITAPHAKPNPAWLSYVVTSKARGAHPPFPEDHALRGIGAARRTPAGPGAGGASGRAGGHRRWRLGSVC